MVDAIAHLSGSGSINARVVQSRRARGVGDKARAGLSAPYQLL